MAQSHPVTIPLINPNEPSALLATLDVEPGQVIHLGDKLCTLETTKSTQELLADFEGYIAGLTVKQGEFVD